MSIISESAMEARARRAARRHGLVARKSRWRVGSIDNFGGFMIFDPIMNIPVYGDRWDLSPEHVIEWCRDEDEAAA